MPLLTRADLQYIHSWIAIPGDDPHVSGEPDHTLFNREEGSEVLYLINKTAENYHLRQKASGLKIEKLIHEQPPSHIRSQKEVMKWVVKNFKSIRNR